MTLDDRPLARWPRRELARSVTYLAQEARCSWAMAVRRIVALGRLPHLATWQRAGAEDEQDIANALHEAGVLHPADRNVLILSGGERTRVMLARTLAGSPRFLLADEPVAGLDPAHQLQVMHLAKKCVMKDDCPIDPSLWTEIMAESERNLEVKAAFIACDISIRTAREELI